MLNPNDFIITRKRKKYKFAKFANSDLCFEFGEWQQRKIDTVEMGAGTGLFSVELASRYPEKTFLAVDVKGDRLQTGAYEAEARNLDNIWFLRARADQIAEIVNPNSVENLWINFADPFPKKRSAKRRMTHAQFLEKYQTVLTDQGKLNIKHDNPDFFKWSLEQVVLSKMIITKLYFDLDQTEATGDFQVLTTYEQRWRNEGRVIGYFQAGKNCGETAQNNMNKGN